MSNNKYEQHRNGSRLDAFSSDVVDQIMSSDTPGVWDCPGGQLVLPRVFGFCRGVKRALAMAEKASEEHRRKNSQGKLVLLGEIIHNPWVNEYFRSHGVEILTTDQRRCAHIGEYLGPNDCAIIPAFGVPLPIENRLKEIGCQIIDCSCGDVIRLWRWSQRAVEEGFAVLIFGRAMHDETVVTKSRLADADGRYLVVETLEETRRFAEMIASGQTDAAAFADAFSPDATNSDSIEPFLRLAQVSQTTMLYNHTMEVRDVLQQAFARRFGDAIPADQLRFQPTVCRATQDRQNAAVELCQDGCDLVIVVGGFGSSNTRHLHELASQYAPAFLIEHADSIQSEKVLLAWDNTANGPVETSGWLPAKRPLKVGVLAGASSPEIVIGQVLQRLAEFLQ